MKNFSIFKSYLTRLRGLAVLTIIALCTFCFSNVRAGNVTWEQVAWGDITTSDVIIVTVTTSNGTYLLEHSQGTSATPKLGNTGTLSVSNTKCTFSENDNVKWKKDASNRLCKASDGTKWLYTGTSNNAMRVGTSTSGNVWSLDGDYIKSNASTARYLSVYSTTDFRSYTSKQSGQVTRFYKASSAPSYTITAQSNNNSYGTVSLSGSVITGSPNSGYQYASPAYSVSPANSATVSQVGNEFTVTPSANTTVTINFEAKPSASISFVNAGTQAPTTSGYYVGDSYTLPSTNNYSCNGKTFVGWSTVPVDETDIKPTSNFYEPGASATLAASQTFYAVFASVTEGTGDWEQCNSSTIADGDYLIVQSDYMMTNTLNSQRFNKTSISVSDGVISYDANADWSAYTWHIAETSTSGIFTIKNGSNYVIGTGTASKIDLDASPTDGKELFAITYQSTPKTYKIESKYNESQSVNRWLRNGGTYFACYADGGYPYLFKRGNGYGNYSTDCCSAPATALSISGSDNVTTGNTSTYSIGGGNGGTVTWSVTNGTGSATINSSGVLTAGSVGTVTVKAHQDATGGYCAQDAEKTVTIVSSTVNVIGVSVTPTSKSIVVGETFTITPTVSPNNATDKSVSWSSSASGKASVSNGTVTGVEKGLATITCKTTDGNKTATTSVTVYNITVQKQDETGATISADGVSASATGKSLSASATDASKYVFHTWKYATGGQGGLDAIPSATSTSTTLTGTPTGDVTIIAEFYKPCVVTWSVNENESVYESETVARGDKVTIVPRPDPEDYCGDKFVGWYASDYDDDDTAPTGTFKNVNDSPEIEEDKTFYAVFADFAE